MMDGKVVGLFMSPRSGCVEAAESIRVAPGGVVGDKNFGKSNRELLIMDRELLEKHSQTEGKFAYNIVVRGVNVHGLEQGRTLRIGDVKFTVGDKLGCGGENPAMKGERGVFLAVCDEGTISKDDPVVVL